MLATPVTPLPLWWRNACVSYDLQQDAAASFPTAAALSATCFAKWTTTSAPPRRRWHSGVSIDVRDLGPVACDQVQYNQDQGNQHVIIFHDDVWPLLRLEQHPRAHDGDLRPVHRRNLRRRHGDQRHRLPRAERPRSADRLRPREHHDARGRALSGDGAFGGHRRHDVRQLRAWVDDDARASGRRLRGLCSIYLPDRRPRRGEPVWPTANGASKIACDPTPRHGFSTQCGTAPSKSCDVSPAPRAGRGSSRRGSCYGLASSRARLRRRRGPTPGAS